MVADSNLFWFGSFLWLASVWLIVSAVGADKRNSGELETLQQQETQLRAEIEQLQQQCQRLRTELEQQSRKLTADFRESTFEQLQTLLTNYSSARQMAKAKPDLPAKNLVSLFAPLENLLNSWGYEPIGVAWERVPFNPQYHQPDAEDIAEGELVYVRFVGYREGDRILCPAKVSRTLPLKSKR